MESIEDETTFTPPPGGRRGFLKGACAILVGGAALLAAPLAGLRVFLQPLWGGARNGGGRWVRVVRLAALPNDGMPRRFPVVADHVNAWNRVPKAPIGAVFLRRTGEGDLHALNVICPHAGCLVNSVASGKHFHCPCHDSRFALDGGVDDPASPSPRGMDALEVELRNGDEVWVCYQEFRAGIQERVPVA